ncbi:Monodehydroascorbate reductase 4, peroxisomal [Asimina triloba]
MDPIDFFCVNHQSVLERLSYPRTDFAGIELVLGTRVKSVDVRRKTLVTAPGETISYKILIIATGARALKLEEFGVTGSDAENVCYLRNLADATRLVEVMKSSAGGKAVVIGGGYIGMECAASLVINKIQATMVFPEKHCISKLFTPKIAEFYEEYYKSKGVKFIKGNVLSSFETDSTGKVTAIILRGGTRLSADMVVVGIGIRPNTSLFEGQLALDKGGIKVNGHMQTSDSSVYAVGDVAAFPVKLFGEARRLEHVDSARKSAKHAVAAIMAPNKTGDLDYLPFFYSRVFALSWQFYGDSVGEVVHYGNFSSGPFGAYWVNKGRLVGAFLEGGNREEYEAIAKATKLRPLVKDLGELENQGLQFAVLVSQQPAATIHTPTSSLLVEQHIHAWHAVAGVVVAASIAAVAFWYGRRRRRW